MRTSLTFYCSKQKVYCLPVDLRDSARDFNQNSWFDCL